MRFFLDLFSTPAFWIAIIIVAFVVCNRYEHGKRNALYSIVLNGNYDIQKIASTAQMDYKAVEKRLNKLISLANSPKEKVSTKWTAFAGAHIDYQKKQIVLDNSILKSGNAEINQPLNTAVSMDTITCSGCGSINTIPQGGTSKCEYCGITLVSNKPLTTQIPIIESQPVVTTSLSQPINVHETVNSPTPYVFQPYYSQASFSSQRKKSVALILCIFLGFFGGHMFYVGRVGLGILYLFTAGLFFVGIIVDLLKILSGTFKDSNGSLIKQW